MSGFFHKLFSDENLPTPQQPGVTAKPETGARRFTVAELVTLLPPEFVRTQGVDLNREVDLDLSTARRTLVEGRAAVLLSEVHQACPEIFHRPVPREEDFEVRLPTARVRALLGEPAAAPASPFGVAAPAAAAEAVPGSMVGPFQVVAEAPASPFAVAPPAGAPPQTSPFMVASAPAPAASPFGIAPTEPAAAPGPMASPFQPVPAQSPFSIQGNIAPAPESAPTAPAPVESPFEVVGAQPPRQAAPIPPAPREVPSTIPAPAFVPGPASPFRPVVEPAPTALVPAAPPVADGGDIHFDLADTLRAVPADLLGFVPSHLPPGIECRVPKTSAKPGFFPGTAMVSLRDVVNSLPAAYRGVFTQAKMDYEVAVPVPMDAPVAPVTTESTPLFETPFAALAKEDAALAPPAPPAPLAPLAPVEPAMAPLEAMPPSPAVVPPPVPAAPVVAMAPAVPVPVPEAPPPLPEPPAAAVPVAPPPVEVAVPVPVFTPAPIPAPVPAPVPAQATVQAPSGEMDEWKQLELRAVFGLSVLLDGKGIFDLAAGLPGIRAAAFFRGPELVFRQAPDGTTFSALPDVFHNLLKLASDLGVSDARNFTLQTDRGMVAFFSEGPACLAVMHEGRQFAPGVRERLVLIFRELARSA